MITVLKPGLLTTIQDEGRPGWRAFGMPDAGALDGDAYAAANLLAGNAPGAAAIEMTLLGGAFRFERDAFVAVAGAELLPRLDGAPVATWSALPVAAGSVLAFSGAAAGVRAYLAVRGGIDVPVVLGSRSTYTRACVGGFQGRALAAGDVLPIGAVRLRADALRSPRTDTGGDIDPDFSVRPERGPAERAGVEGRPFSLARSLVPAYGRELRLRVTLGPQDDRFAPSGIATFLGSAYAVTNRNDRMAYQLEGPAIRHARGPDIVSDATIPGSVQVPGSGLPIVLTADCATVGGYTKIASVISADLPRLAQAKAGDVVRFERCTQDEAVEALRRRAAWLADVARAAGTAAGGDR